MRLKRKFFLKSTLKVAQELLGKYLVRVWRGKKLIGKIVETEAYIGPEDKAAHSYNNKKTKRNIIEYAIGGKVYIYLVYGMYWQMNFVTGKKNKPECVLIRAMEPIKNIFPSTKGPGNLCKALKLDKDFYGEDLVKSKKLYLREGEKVSKKNIIVKPRVGIDYAGPYWAKKEWRFYIKNNPFVSKK